MFIVHINMATGVLRLRVIAITSFVSREAIESGAVRIVVQLTPDAEYELLSVIN